MQINVLTRLVGSSEHGEYGDAVTEVDQGVGRIIAAIREVGQESNTLVYFTSDHGGDQPQLGNRGGFNGVFRGGKGNGALEGGMRVPGIVKVRHFWTQVSLPRFSRFEKSLKMHKKGILIC